MTKIKYCKKFIPLLIASSVVLSGTGCALTGHIESEAAQSGSGIGVKLMTAALPWEHQPYRVGLAEQCMNWTREVLVRACGSQFRTLETDQPWDGHLLGEGDKLLPEHADSLASEQLGLKITSIADLQRGDLVFLKNTYGNWADGVITHVGIATGDGHYIHRMTSNKGLVKIEPIVASQFDAGLRLDSELCSN